MDEYQNLSKAEKIENTFVDRIEYQEKLLVFKYYLAHQFYQDNLGRVEILQANDKIIQTTFKMPSYVNLLPPASRK